MVSLGWLINRYLNTAYGPEQKLSSATRRQRENIFKHVLETAGDKPTSKITAATILVGRERRAQTPARRAISSTPCAGCSAGRQGQHVKVDPTGGVETPPRKKGDGFMAWTEEHVEAYERRWPIGTRQRVWLDVLLYTGLRRGDAVRLGRQHVRDGIAQIKTEKSGFTVDGHAADPAGAG